jgi:hypothetical protein
MTRWVEILDRFEAALDWHAERANGSFDGESPWVEPSVIDEPLPPELHERARRLVDRSRELSTALSDKLDSMPTLGNQHRAQSRSVGSRSNTFSTRL